MRDSTRSRALAALQGLALGDALGMPTQSLARERIAADHGRIRGLVAAGPHQQIAAGMPAGSITDDTEQAVLLARLLIDGDGTVPPGVFAAELLAWERAMEARGSLDLLGPSTRAALQRLQDGMPPEEAGRFGATNGAAMRITPVGIAVPVEPLGGFVDAVVRVSSLTHNTGLGIASAAAVGAAVSAGLDGADAPEALDVAVAAAREGAGRGHWVAGGDIAARLEWAIPYLLDLAPREQDDALVRVVGTSVAAQESVVAALSLVALAVAGTGSSHRDRPGEDELGARRNGIGATTSPDGDAAWDALCRAASLGGDTDTIAAMAGAVLGATWATDWPRTAVETVRRVNALELEPLVDGLLRVRRRHG
ncbi:ADP-ribosylglycohydrolase family protein [Leifsonia sp. NPDC077715]|uniref:ADP-ribosylglycohydrolase family protein n=1 Tax=Leifsonia sp. NPDC077715 TaxID=3155539 RepID=UPI0034222ED3